MNRPRSYTVAAVLLVLFSLVSLMVEVPNLARGSSDAVDAPPFFLTITNFVLAILGFVAAFVVWRVGGATFVAAGILLCLWSISVFWRARTSLVPVKPSTALVVAGPYRFTRNPMYLGLLLVYVSMALWMNVLWGLMLLPIVVMVVQRLVIQKEERYLERKFGVDFLHYMMRVRRWL